MTGSRAVIAAVIVVLGLAGCSSEDPEPKVAPSAPVSSSTVEPAGPSAPELVSDLSRTGAERFLRFWFEVLSEGMASGETATLRGYSSAGCVSCQALIKQIDDLYAKGGRVESAGWTVQGVALNGRFDRSSPSFILRVNQSRRILLEGDRVVDQTPRALVPMHVRLSSSEGQWAVADLEIIQ